MGAEDSLDVAECFREMNPAAVLRGEEDRREQRPAGLAWR